MAVTSFRSTLTSTRAFCTVTFMAGQRVTCVPVAAVFRRGGLTLTPRTQRFATTRLCSRSTSVRGLQVYCGDFKEVKQKLKSFLDLGKESRLKTIHAFYSSVSKENMDAHLSDTFTMSEEGHARNFTKQDYMNVMLNFTLPAIPDFNWGHATNGEVDGDGYCVVIVQSNGHHTGAPFSLPGLPPLPPSGRHFCLVQEVQRVRVEGDKIQDIKVLPAKGAGPRALYRALGGSLPEDLPETLPVA